MGFPKLLAWLVALIMTITASAKADVMTNFFDVSVPVDSTDGTQLASASQLALQTMLIRLSGTESVLQNQRLQLALNDANQFISQYGYLRDDDGGIVAKFNFSASSIEQLLNQAGEPVWALDRPSALLWLAVEDDTELRIATKGDPIFDAFLAAARARGLVVKSPLYDLQDRFGLSAEQLWAQDITAVEAVSERYPANTVIMARALQDSRGAWHLNWDVLRTGGLNAGSESCISLNDCLAVPVAELAERWSAKYAVVSKFSAEQNLQVSVSGLDFDAYSRVVEYWKGLPAMGGVMLTAIRGDQYQFELRWQADKTTFVDLLNLNTSLQIVSAPSASELMYQWFE